MRTGCTTALLVAMALALPVALPGQTDVKGLEKAIHGKTLGLRNYSADSVAQYTWVDGELLSGPVALHGLEAFLGDSVKLKDGKIVFRGNRVTLVRDGTDLATVVRSPMTLEVDLQGADPAVVVPQLQAALFFPDLGSAIAGLPRQVAYMLPAQLHKTPQSQNEPTIGMEKSTKYKPPVTLYTVDPVYNQDARDKRVSGEVSLAIHISDKGRVDEVWLLKPVGFGLDESAARAVWQYVFKPAKLDGEPVEATLGVTIEFEIF